MPNIKKIIAISSGKGGVGKSTITVNLAIETAKKGYKVGVVDADIYGPSTHYLLGLNKQKPKLENGKMTPLENHGVKLMSMGFLVPENAALIWRGPMITKALNNMINHCNWGDLDYLFIDMPPGTGDAHLSLVKNFPLDAALIVSSPQIIALLDVAKAIDMFKKVKTPILGIIENMSYLQNKDGTKNYIFGQGKLKDFAKKHKVKILGEIPLDAEISQQADLQQPYLPKNSLKAVLKAI